MAYVVRSFPILWSGNLWIGRKRKKTFCGLSFAFKMPFVAHKKNEFFMLLTIKAHLKKRTASAIVGTLYIRVLFERESIYFNLFEQIPVSDFDHKKCIVIKNINADSLNDLIITEKSALHKKIIDQKLMGKILTVDLIKSLQAKTTNKTLMSDLVIEYGKERNIGKHRKEHYQTTLRAWEAAKLPLYIESVTRSHVLTFRDSVQDEKAFNTVLAHLIKLNALLGYAVQIGIVVKNVMEGLKKGQWKSNIKYLTIEELNIIIDNPEKLDKYEKVLIKLFLFQCFTGIRYGDVTTLKPHMFLVENGTAYLDFTMNKGGAQLKIPLLPQAVELWPEVVGKYYSNQYYNRSLKNIVKKLGIDKHVTTHLARHTFGSIAVKKGMHLLSVQKLMGHTKIETTMLYTHLDDETKLIELNKWNTNMTATPE